LGENPGTARRRKPELGQTRIPRLSTQERPHVQGSRGLELVKAGLPEQEHPSLRTGKSQRARKLLVGKRRTLGGQDGKARNLGSTSPPRPGKFQVEGVGQRLTEPIQGLPDRTLPKALTGAERIAGGVGLLIFRGKLVPSARPRLPLMGLQD